jgi:small subunit ribosomal protein S2
MTINVSLEKLIESGAHFGHQVKRWNPRMKPYIYGKQGNVHVFDLIKTKECLDKALGVIKEAAKNGRAILIVGTKKQVKEKVAQIAQEAGVFYVNERWLGGTLTNFDQIKISINKLIDMKKKLEGGEYNKFTKKERILIEREIARLERFFGGIINLTALPELIVIIDIKKEKGAVKEAEYTGIETIGVVDSNSNPEAVDWPIPMNDDATRALEYVLDLIKEAIMEGKTNSGKKVEKVVKVQ